MTENWEARWQAGDTPWDFGAAAPPLLDYLARPDCVLRSPLRVLVPGCGSGHDVRALAGAGLSVTGLDLSPSAVEVARAIPSAGDESYLCGDFFDSASLAPHPFQAIWEHTCFCAIDPSLRPRYAASAAAILPPGGHLCGVFYLETGTPPDEGPPFGATSQEIVALLQSCFDLVHHEVPSSAYPGREGREWFAIFRRRP